MVKACAVYDNKIVDIYEVPDFFSPNIEYPYYEGAKIGDIYRTKEYDINERIGTLESDNALLKQQLKAASDQNDFLEDCIAEMAGIVYA